MQRTNIFDFDLTISVEHTFNSNKIEMLTVKTSINLENTMPKTIQKKA